MNKKLIFSTMLFLLLFSLFSCSSSISPANIIAEYEIPFLEPNSRWTEVNELEKDEYGRTIYSYKSEGDYSNVLADFMKGNTYSPVWAYVLCQKQDNRSVYCYPEVCYIYLTSSQPDASQLEEWKKQNDWNLPLDESRMTALPVNLKSNGISDFAIYSVEKDAIRGLEQEIKKDIEKYFLDVVFSAKGIPVFVLREVKNWSHETNHSITFGESYIFCINSEEVLWEKLEGNAGDWCEQIASFKQSLEDKERHEKILCVVNHRPVL